MSEREAWSAPAGWACRALPGLSPEGSAVSVCVLVREGGGSGGDAGEARVMDLPDEPDARVVLGALADAGGTVHAWLRIAMQDTGRVARTLGAGAAALNNRLLDERWLRSCDAMGETLAGEAVRTGLEGRAAGAWIVDAGGVVREARAVDGRDLSVCTDDGALEGAGLAPYGRTLHRYLWTGPSGEGEGALFYAVTDGAPVSEGVVGVVGVETLLGDGGVLLHRGGRVRVTRLATIDYESFADVLGGAPAPGVRSGRTVIGLTGLWGEPGGASGHAGEEGDEDETSSGWLFQTRQGQSGRLIEMLHLKLRLLADAIEAVETATRVSRRPMLNVSPELFGVRLGASGRALPRLWSARVVLTGAGSAVELPMAESDERVFVSGASSSGPTVYAPEGGRIVSGRCDLRLREVVVEDVQPGAEVGELVVEGTFGTNEALSPSSSDLLAVHAMLGDRSLTLRGRLEEDQSLAAGEWRFRSLRTPMGSGDRGAVRSACGAPLRGVRFELLPRLTSPRDLYGLMVLGVRTLLVDGETTLAKAVDEVLSLARQVGAEHESSVPLGERIGAIFERDERWMASLGPQRLVLESLDARTALDLTPRGLWYDALGLLVRMAPGWGPDSFVGGMGDASSSAPHLIYGAVRSAMSDLLLRSRSLVVVDWRENREIASVLRRARSELRGSGSGG